jgi:hypothetical protein
VTPTVLFAAVPGNGVDNSDVILSLSKAVAASVGKPEQVCYGPVAAQQYCACAQLGVESVTGRCASPVLSCIHVPCLSHSFVSHRK